MWSIRKIHKYIAIVIGAVFLLWLVSGVIMMLPQPTPGAVKASAARGFDISGATLTPAAAVARLQQQLGTEIEVLRVSLLPLPGRLVYDVRAREPRATLVDAGNGEIVEVTPELAERIAREHLREDVGEASVELLERHTPTYPWGPLPAYRLEFAAGRGTIAYVGKTDAAVSFTDLRKQIWTLFNSVHNFGILDFLLGSDRVHRPLLLLAAAFSLVLVITGYYMVFFTPRQRRARAARRARQEPRL